MASVNLLPNADVANDWTLSTGSDVYALLDDDTTGQVAVDSSYLSATSATKTFTVGMENFTESYSSIDSVTGFVRCGCGQRSKTYSLDLAILHSGGTFVVIENSGTINSNRFYQSHTYTARTTSDGSTSWTNSDLNDIRFKLTLNSISASATVNITYCHFIVTYTEAVADNSIFFGTNF